MNTRLILGCVLLGVGVVALMLGIQGSHSVADQISKTFTGRFTQATTWYILGGSAAALLGLAMLLTGSRRKNA